MIHKDCGGNVLLNCNSIYTIGSPSIRITVNGIFPGMIQIDSVKNGKGLNIFRCSKCNEEFSTKSEFDANILEACSICQEMKSPSDLILCDSINNLLICNECATSDKFPENTRRGRLLSLYSGIIKKSTGKTLLDILTIKK